MTVPFCAGVGMSNGSDPLSAGRSAARAALKQAGAGACDFAFVFCNTGHDQGAIIKAVRDATGGLPVAGCSGEGVIARLQRSESAFGTVVMVCRAGPYRFRNAMAADACSDPEGAGALLGERLCPLADDALAVLLFSDGLTVDVERVVRGLESSLPRPLPVFGGRAGGARFGSRTFQYHDDLAFSDGVSAVLVAGEGEIVTASTACCFAVGPQRIVTRAEGTSLYELDGKSAVALFEDYLGPGGLRKLPCPLALALIASCDSGGPEDFIARAVRRIDLARGVVELSAPIEPGARVSLALPDSEMLWNNIERLGRHLQAALRGRPPRLILQFESSGRSRGLLREEERQRVVTRLHELIGAEVPWCGAYTYGEVVPVCGQSKLNDYTTSIAVLT